MANSSCSPHSWLIVTCYSSYAAFWLYHELCGGRAISFFEFELLSAPEKTPWLADAGSFVHHSSVLIIVVILALHIAAALKHQFVDKDGMLSRMLGKS
ncbi:cytochrome b [Pseudoalteromonas sp. NCCP-2140]|uniref:cytochrome b n=1 Tax=Pseudoalteromonas sp. NCCP-2140 TaxID=2942288 RepID=UPI00203F6C58|nr:cytochrome b/b6 domain-containing protein [Pseudoalteromonas sp. NCCP-2140]